MRGVEHPLGCTEGLCTPAEAHEGMRAIQCSSGGTDPPLRARVSSGHHPSIALQSNLEPPTRLVFAIAPVGGNSAVFAVAGAPTLLPLSFPVGSSRFGLRREFKCLPDGVLRPRDGAHLSPRRMRFVCIAKESLSARFLDAPSRDTAISEADATFSARRV